MPKRQQANQTNLYNPNRKQLYAVENPLAVALYNFEQSTARRLETLRREDFLSEDIVRWVTAYRYIHGRPWSFESPGPLIEYGDEDVRSQVLKRPYLFKYLQDRSREKSVIKSRQTEMTENSINELLFYIITRPHTAVTHLFPTDEISDQVSVEKVGMAIHESPKIDHELSSGAVRRYVFHNGSIYSMSGSLKKAGGRAGSRDILVIDEYDQISESVVGVFKQLLSHSSLQLVRNVSTPTVPDVGIDKKVKLGSYNQWFWKCEYCKKEQSFSWPENLINFFEVDYYDENDENYIKRLNKVFIGCKHCGKYVNRNTDFYIANSQWVTGRPLMADLHASYIMNAMMIPWKTGKELLRYYHKLQNYITTWANEHFGMAYLKGESRLGESEVRACIRKFIQAQQFTQNMSFISVGIDWGDRSSWVVVMARGFDPEKPDLDCIVYVEEINDQVLEQHRLIGHPMAHCERARMICELFQAQIIVNDAQGFGTDRNKQMLHYFPQYQRLVGAFFDTAEESRQLRYSKLLVPEWSSDTKHRVRISKTYAVKEIHNLIRQERLGLPMEAGPRAGEVRKLVQHLQNLGIQPRYDLQREREYEVVVKLAEMDHLHDAVIYAYAGLERMAGFGTAPIGVILKK